MARNAPGPDDGLEFADEERGERDGPQLKDWTFLLLRAARQRKVLFLAVFVIGCGAVLGYYRLKRPLYRVDTKILAQRQQVVPSSLRMGAEDNPTHTAWELIHRRDNLLALIKSAGLMGKAGPSAIEQIQRKTGLGSDAVDPLDKMVTLLDRSLKVGVEEGTITISLDWPDPKQAYAVVEGALQNFIEARHVQEVTAIDEVMSVLRVRAANAKDQLDRVTDEVRREAVEGYRDAPATSAPRATSAARPHSDELVRLKSLLDGKQRAIEDVEEFRRRRLAELHAQLDEKRNTYSDAHPSVIQLKQDIESLTKDSSQVATLRDDEAKLRKDYDARLAQEGVTEGTPTAQPTSPTRPNLPRQRAAGTPVEDDERVRGARFEYQQIEGRVNAAELELDAVRAAFKYRYNVIWPPQVPVDPVSPNPVKVFTAGFLAAFILAVLAAAAPDLRAGRILERWQVERSLDLPILGELPHK